MAKDASGARQIALRYIDSGDKRLKTGDIDLAIQAHERAVATLERVERESPARDEYASGYPGDLASDMHYATNQLGRALFSAGRVEEAIAMLERSLASHESASRVWSDSSSNQRNAISTEHFLAHALCHIGDHDKAEEVIQTALARARDLDSQGELTGANDATIAGLENYLERIGVARGALVDWPPPESLSEEYHLLSCYYRVLYAARRGEFEIAEETLTYWTSRSPQGDERYNLACGHAILADALGAEKTTIDKERRSRIDRHIAASLATLRDAFATGYSEYEHARGDLDFVALRKLPEFRSIVQAK